jgi:hypothetical protein
MHALALTKLKVMFALAVLVPVVLRLYSHAHSLGLSAERLRRVREIVCLDVGVCGCMGVCLICTHSHTHAHTRNLSPVHSRKI